MYFCIEKTMRLPIVRPLVLRFYSILEVTYAFCGTAISVLWWRHPLETFPALLAICAGNSPVTGEFPAQRPVTRSFDVFFNMRLNKRLSKQWRGWWFEMPSRPLWSHCNVLFWPHCDQGDNKKCIDDKSSFYYPRSCVNGPNQLDKTLHCNVFCHWPRPFSRDPIQ